MPPRGRRYSRMLLSAPSDLDRIVAVKATRFNLAHRARTQLDYRYRTYTTSSVNCLSHPHFLADQSVQHFFNQSSMRRRSDAPMMRTQSCLRGACRGSSAGVSKAGLAPVSIRCSSTFLFQLDFHVDAGCKVKLAQRVDGLLCWFKHIQQSLVRPNLEVFS
jgi:hypothetical protein